MYRENLHIIILQLNTPVATASYSCAQTATIMHKDSAHVLQMIAHAHLR